MNSANITSLELDIHRPGAIPWSLSGVLSNLTQLWLKHFSVNDCPAILKAVLRTVREISLVGEIDSKIFKQLETFPHLRALQLREIDVKSAVSVLSNPVLRSRLTQMGIETITFEDLALFGRGNKRRRIELILLRLRILIEFILLRLRILKIMQTLEMRWVGWCWTRFLT